jgi:hypothetical protein
MMHQHTKVLSLTLAVASALAGVAKAGHEIVDEGKKQMIVEEPARLSGSISAGYSSRYIFRGTNLMPGSNGMIYADAHVSYGGFTAGVWVGTQQGSADVEGARAIGEGGGGGGGFAATASGGGGAALGSQVALGDSVFTRGGLSEGLLAELAQPGVTGDELVRGIAEDFAVSRGTVLNFLRTFGFVNPATGAVDVFGEVPQDITKAKVSSVAQQDRFNEIDLYLQYSFSVGPVDVTVGNIFFYIDRDATTRLTLQEYFASEDARDLVSQLSRTTLLDNLRGTLRPEHPEDFLINKGKKVSRTFEGIEDEQFDRLFVSLSTSTIPYITPRITYYQTIYNEGTEAAKELHVLRNDEKGGYLEAKVNAEIPLIKDRLNLDPYALVSYSFGDRSEPDGSALYDWNHFQAGAELVFQVTDNFRLVPQINYMTRLSDPTPGTEQNEWWGGAQAEVVF